MADVHSSWGHLFHLAASAHPASLYELPDAFHRVDIFFQGYGNDGAVESLFPVDESDFIASPFQFIAKAGSPKTGGGSEFKIREEKFKSDSENLQSARTDTQRPARYCKFQTRE